MKKFLAIVVLLALIGGAAYAAYTNWDYIKGFIPGLGDGEHVHTEVEDAAVAATCTEAGKTAGKHCSECNEVLVAQETIPAKGHTEVEDAAVAATCTEAGKTAGKHCSECNEVLVAQETVPAKGHTEVDDAAVAPTCTEAGKTAGKHCSVCNTVTVAQETVPANGHTEVDDAAVAPTCTEAGKTAGKHCSVCNTVTVAQESIPAGHKFVNGICSVCEAADPDYVPEVQERKHVFGVTFEQGRNNYKITPELFNNIVTANKHIPEEGIRDLIVALITLKYTQSNSVCFAYDGQAIGVGAGQQSRIHCTRLAGNKADLWHLRQHEKVLSLPFRETVGRAERDNAIDIYLSDQAEEDLLCDGIWQTFFSSCPAPFTAEEKKEYLRSRTGASVGSDAFFPFGDNVERARRSGVSYIAQPGGSVRDDLVIEACDKFGIAMAFIGMRLFHQ